MLRVSLLFLLQALILSSAYGDSLGPGLADEGRQLYRTATRSDGSAIRALVQHDVPLPPGLGACSNCHRRSGLGVSEGGSRSLNITAPALFNATDKPPIRPAYDDQTLTQAIVAGTASDGRELHPTMPRYELSHNDATALAAYLRTLGATLPDGVDDEELTVATVIADSAPAAEREAVTRVLQKYVELRNNESRRDSERAAASDRHFYGRSRQRAYRRWNLRIWTLSGSASTWRKQLDAHYEEDKPFVILSGTAGSNWSPVHELCETREIPCLLPVSDGPANADDDFYPLYYSTGPVVEAGVIATHLQRSHPDRDDNILVVHRNTANSGPAIDKLAADLDASGFANVEWMAVDKPLSKRKWRKVLRAKSADILVAWVSEGSLRPILDPEFDARLLPEVVYTSESFTSWSDTATPVSDRIRHVYPYSVAAPGLAQFPREYLWLKQRGLSDLDSVAASKALYACRVLGMGLADIQSNFSREYLLEMLEHALDGTQMTSLFPRTSLGPNQRVLSRGAYVVNPLQLRDGQSAKSEWIQP